MKTYIITFITYLLISSNVYASECTKQDAIDTLAMAAYFEGRSDGIDGMSAVMEVILVRVESWRWPDDVCKVVYQPSNNINNDKGCAFSYLCDGITQVVTKEVDIYEKAVKLAEEIVEGGFHYSITNYSDHYAKCNVLHLVSWDDNMEFMGVIGTQCFFKGRHIFE